MHKSMQLVAPKSPAKAQITALWYLQSQHNDFPFSNELLFLSKVPQPVTAAFSAPRTLYVTFMCCLRPPLSCSCWCGNLQSDKTKHCMAHQYYGNRIPWWLARKINKVSASLAHSEYWLRRKDSFLCICGDQHWTAFCARYKARLTLISFVLKSLICMVYHKHYIFCFVFSQALWCSPPACCSYQSRI